MGNEQQETDDHVAPRAWVQEYGGGMMEPEHQAAARAGVHLIIKKAFRASTDEIVPQGYTHNTQ